MHIGSGLNTVSSMYRQQKGNNMKAPVSAEKTFYTAETPKVYQIFTTDNMLWTGGNGTGLSYCLKYADDSTDENPVVLAKGVDENGKEFEQRIYINDVDPSNATVVEMRALEAHYKVEKQGGFTSLPLEAGNMGLNDRRDFIAMFKKSIEDLRKVNEMYVPEQLQAGFSDMIDEYVHFNDSARNSIMEKMTPDYMVVGIGSKTESYKYKSEIISDETAFYTNEKKEISGICNQFLNGKTDQKLFCNEMKDRLNDYYGSRYELRNQPEAVEGRVNNMLDKLQHMFGV